MRMALKLLNIGMRIENTVMLIDDDPDDLEILQDAISAIDGRHKIVTASDGVEGLQKLNELSASGSLPCLIVLDLNMPKLDGKQTFVAIKASKQLSKLPVVIFSTSSSMLDKSFFDRYDVAYFVKPVNFRQFVETASRLINYCSHNI